MPGGDLSEYVRTYPGVDRFGLVGASCFVWSPLTPAASYLVSLMASASSTAATWLTVISRGYVVILSSFLLLTRS